MLRLGIGDKAETRWDGSVTVSGGELVKVVGYEMRVGDLVHPPRRWEASTRPAFPFSRRPHDEGWLTDMAEPVLLTPRIYLYLRGGDSAEVSATTAEGDFRFRVGNLPASGPKMLLEGRVSAERAAYPVLLGRRGGEPDDVRVSTGAGNCWEPSLTIDSKGNLFVAHDQYGSNGYDVVLRAHRGRSWQVSATVATPRFEAYPTVAADREDRIWLAWHESGVNWGKDWGYPYDITEKATGLYNSRNIRVA
jgi:hypothetical protein